MTKMIVCVSLYCHSSPTPSLWSGAKKISSMHRNLWEISYLAIKLLSDSFNGNAETQNTTWRWSKQRKPQKKVPNLFSISFGVVKKEWNQYPANLYNLISRWVKYAFILTYFLLKIVYMLMMTQMSLTICRIVIMNLQWTLPLPKLLHSHLHLFSWVIYLRNDLTISMKKSEPVSIFNVKLGLSNYDIDCAYQMTFCLFRTV